MRFLTSLALVLLLGCDGSTEPGSDSGTRTDAGASADASAPVDSGTSVDSGTTDAGPPTDAGPFTGAGAITVMFVSSGVLANATLTGGAFALGATVDDFRNGSDGPHCSVVASEGSCRAWSCEGAVPTRVDAGTITFSVDGSSFGTVAAGPGEVYFGTLGPGTGRLFAADDAVVATSSGAGVPAFSATTTAPGAYTLSAPSTTAGTAPLTVSWTSGGTAQYADVSIEQAAESVVCTVDASDGSVTVATSLLARFAAGDAQLATRLYNEAEVSAGGGWDILLQVSESNGGQTLTFE